MKVAYTLIALCGFVALVGCGGSPAPQPQANAPKIEFELEGTWKGEMVIDAEASKAVKPEIVEALRDMKMDMAFQGLNVTLSGETGGRPYTSENKWDLVNQDDNIVTIKTVSEDGQEKNHEFFVNDPNSFDMPLVIETAQVGAMRFTRTR